MEIVEKFKNLPDLKKQIINQYLDFIIDDFNINEKVLSDNSWASSGSDFHNECRQELELKNKSIKRQIQLLKTFKGYAKTDLIFSDILKIRK